MLTYFGEDKEDGLSFVDAQPGDEFYLVKIGRFTFEPVYVGAYKVLRVGKRDVVIAGIDSPVESRIRRDTALPHAYLTNEEVAWARTEIKLRNKQKKAWEAIRDAGFKSLPEDLADQIIAWEASLDAEKDTKVGGQP